MNKNEIYKAYHANPDASCSELDTYTAGYVDGIKAAIAELESYNVNGSQDRAINWLKIFIDPNWLPESREES